ncbi:tetratricopeptide repeat protein [Shewanella algae]|uniref:tetratricopeptide repeat protein n=1 Tax=Shewanella algae TaxID=38313 RepID=UPI001FB9F66D|nr:hypothetical protein [Shewanella algae]
MSKDLRRKTAMVLHQIEESLGSFVITEGQIESLNLESLENIHRREADKGRDFNKSSIKDVVEATYLDELFGFALDIAQDTSTLDSINYLYSLFHQLDIYEIRNAISHPNRPFWDCYWYRIATIASDPVHERLGLSEIKEALVSAESGTITSPPDEWLNRVIWQIPNNLPKHFEHGLTGLIGRSKELIELKKYISNPRVNTLALVAPGGAGKTALALDLLNTIISTPSYTKSVNAVVYVTMKTEKLTSEGVVPLDTIETISELQNEIIYGLNDIFDENYESFSKAISDNSNKNILLCIDNLETLLRDNPTSFDDLNYSLPITWKILVTSRVAISNATILPLSNLQQKSAIHLARTYHSKRGGSFKDQKVYKALTEQCFFNPLAIRLSIDLILKGKDIPESLNVANKEIAEFSYNNLIDALSQTSVEILECIFVESLSTRYSLCALLEKTMDEISEAIGELSRTSLISRLSDDEGESYRLNDSVRELLLLSPRNLDIRAKVQNSIEKRRILSKEIDKRQSAEDFPVWHLEHIPMSTDENLKILITEFNKNCKKARKNSEISVYLYRKLKDVHFIHSNNSLFQRTLARSLELLKDKASAEIHYKKAIELDDKNPTNKYLLARLYHNTNRYSLAHELYKPLINSEWTSTDAEVLHFGKSIYQGYFLALLYDGLWERVLNETKEWKETKEYRGIIGTFRASAWKRKMELTVDSDPNDTVKSLISASRILADIFRNNGYLPVTSGQAVKVCEEIEYCFSRYSYQQSFKEEASELLNFVFSHITEISRSLEHKDLTPLLKKIVKIDIPQNPFNSSNFEGYQVQNSYLDVEQQDLSNGLISVVISNRPKDRASYMFAKDCNQKTYFLHFDCYNDGEWRDWTKLSIGDNLHVIPDLENSTKDKAIKVKDIYNPN